VTLRYRRKKMGRMRENPRYNVISMRISDEEREILQEIMETTQKSVSDIMREAMILFKKEWTKPQLENKAA
jgi:predicted transcriptional regulator